jgi:hypothetical protein
VSLLLDAGALIAIERRDRRVAALLRVAQRERIPVRTSAAVVGQVWRDGARQVNLARVLAGTESVDLTLDAGKLSGQLLGEARMSDVVDAHLAMLASDGDELITSDPDDLRSLLELCKVRVKVIALHR